MHRAMKVLKVITEAGSALSVSEILRACPGLSRRTLQRLTGELVYSGQLSATGQGRGRRYAAPRPDKGSQLSTDIPLSPDSRDIPVYVNRPVTARKPVGYCREFLLDYTPQKTRYLEPSLCRQLSQMGTAAYLEAGTYNQQILGRLLIDLSWASSHLEGNTYSLLDTQKLIEQGKTAAGKAAIETQMILNHKTAIELLTENRNMLSFSRHTVFNLHSVLSENLLPNPADEGRIRQYAVEIGKSVYRPLAIPAVIDEMMNALLTRVASIQDPFEQSFFIMVHLPYLQPFADVNKRTSRLLANLPLIQNRLCPLTFLGVSEFLYTQAILGVYEMNRIELLRDLYIWAYERSVQEYMTIQQNSTEPDPLRLAYRDIIRKMVYTIVMQPEKDPVTLTDATLSSQIKTADQENVRALIIAELRRLHEGVLARYGLRPADFICWKKKQNKPT